MMSKDIVKYLSFYQGCIARNGDYITYVIFYNNFPINWYGIDNYFKALR